MLGKRIFPAMMSQVAIFGSNVSFLRSRQTYPSFSPSQNRTRLQSKDGAVFVEVCTRERHAESERGRSARFCFFFKRGEKEREERKKYPIGFGLDWENFWSLIPSLTDERESFCSFGRHLPFFLRTRTRTHTKRRTRARRRRRRKRIKH